MPVAIQRFQATARCNQPSTTPDVALAWVVSGGADAEVEIWRNVIPASGRQSSVRIHSSKTLSGSMSDRPAEDPTGKVTYTLVAKNSSGSTVRSTAPSTPIGAYCLY